VKNAAKIRSPFLSKNFTLKLVRSGFSPVKTVGTDCIHGDADDFVQIDMK